MTRRPDDLFYHAYKDSVLSVRVSVKIQPFL